MSQPTVHVFAWDCASLPTILDLGPTRRMMTQLEQKTWDRARALNPKLHDSPIFAVTARDAQAGEIVVNRSFYSFLVAGQPPEVALGVTGVVIREHMGKNEVLLGRRAAETRLYGGTWETAPRGTVPVPVSDTPANAIVDALLLETAEELGPIDLKSVTPIAIVKDDTASSLDVVYVARVGPATNPTPASWEYDTVAWLPIEEACAWATREHAPQGVFAGASLSPPAEALLAYGLL